MTTRTIPEILDNARRLALIAGAPADSPHAISDYMVGVLAVEVARLELRLDISCQPLDMANLPAFLRPQAD